MSYEKEQTFRKNDLIIVETNKQSHIPVAISLQQYITELNVAQ